MPQLKFKKKPVNHAGTKMPSKTKLRALFIVPVLINLFGCSITPSHSEWRIVNTTFINIRTGPGRGYPITTSILEGERILILYQRTGYTKIRTEENVEGWIETTALPNSEDTTQATK